MRIFHLATHSYNIGDGAVVVGAHEVLGRIFDDIVYDEQCLMEMENFWGSVKYDEALLSRMNSCDLILIGGGGMIDRVRGRRFTGFAFDLPRELWKKIERPVFVYGVGENSFYGQSRSSLSPLLNFIAEVSERVPVLFTVRNDGSLRRLVKDCPHLDGLVRETADPGLFWRRGGLTIESNSHERSGLVPIIGIQVAGDNPKKRSRGSVNVLRVLAEYMERLHQVLKGDVEFQLIPHIVRDVDAVGELISHLPVNLSRLAVQVGAVQRGSKSAVQFFSEYDKCDVVLAMRGHAQICGLDTQAAIIALDTHPKIRGFSEVVGSWHPVHEPSKTNLKDLLKVSLSTLERRDQIVDLQRKFVDESWEDSIIDLGERLCKLV